MAYATQQDMIDRFGEEELVQLTDRAQAGVIDATVLAQALSDANAEIDGYLVGRYTLPLPSVPIALTRIACDLARYYLYDNRATEQVTTRAEEVRAFLMSIAQGKVSLGLDTLSKPATASDGPQTSGPARVFTTDTLEDF